MFFGHKHTPPCFFSTLADIPPFVLFLLFSSLIYFSDLRPSEHFELQPFFFASCRLCTVSRSGPWPNPVWEQGLQTGPAIAVNLMIDVRHVSSLAQIWGISTKSHFEINSWLIITIYIDDSGINNVLINHCNYFTWIQSNTPLMLSFKTWPHYIYHGFMCSLYIQVNRGWHIKMALRGAGDGDGALQEDQFVIEKM